MPRDRDMTNTNRRTARRRVARSGHAEVIVDAPLAAVWALVCDVTRTGEWSHECTDVRWLGTQTTAAPGARFRGRNRSGWVRWSRVCEIVTVSHERELAWRTVSTLLYPDSTNWSIRLEPAGQGTRIIQSFQVVRLPRVLDVLFARALPAHQDRAAALRADLGRIGTVAAAESGGARAVRT